MKQAGDGASTELPHVPEQSVLSTTENMGQREEINQRLDDARERLLALRRQQEDLERQKNDLEELRRKQDEYGRGRTEMIDHLTRGLATLEREQIHAQRLAELCEKTRAAFRDYLDQLQSIRDAEWNSVNLRPELTKALSIIENSRLEYNRARTKLDCLDPSAGLPVETAGDADADGRMDWSEMGRYARLGAAASAPLIVAGTIWLLIALLAR